MELLSEEKTAGFIRPIFRPSSTAWRLLLTPSFAVHLLDMPARRADRQGQALGDLAAGQALPQQDQDFPLPVGERLDAEIDGFFWPVVHAPGAFYQLQSAESRLPKAHL